MTLALCHVPGRRLVCLRRLALPRGQGRMAGSAGTPWRRPAHRRQDRVTPSQGRAWERAVVKKTGAGRPERADHERAAERHDAGRGAVISPYPDGPLIVRGEFVITGRDGLPVASGRRTVALCRCGQSAGKPFCDGSHARTGFRPRSSPGQLGCRCPHGGMPVPARRKAHPAKTSRHARMTAGSGQARHLAPGSTTRRTRCQLRRPGRRPGGAHPPNTAGWVRWRSSPARTPTSGC